MADGGEDDVGGITVAAFEVASAEVAVALSCGRSRARWRIAAGARVWDVARANVIGAKAKVSGSKPVWRNSPLPLLRDGPSRNDTGIRAGAFGKSGAAAAGIDREGGALRRLGDEMIKTGRSDHTARVLYDRRSPSQGCPFGEIGWQHAAQQRASSIGLQNLSPKYQVGRPAS